MIETTIAITAAGAFSLSIFEQAISQQFLGQLLVLQSAVLALIGLSSRVPASVDFYLSSLAEILNLDILNAEETSDRLFKFSKTDPYSLSMDQIGMGTSNCILNMSDLFYAVSILLIITLIGLLLKLCKCKC